MIKIINTNGKWRTISPAVGVLVVSSLTPSIARLLSRGEVMYVFVILLLSFAMSCQVNSPAEPSEALPSGPEYPTEIRTGRVLGKLDLKIAGPEYAGVECGVCHTEPAGPDAAEVASDLKEFHVDMQFGHGALTCNSCHNPEERSELRLANGKSVQFADTMQLCAQCHGPQSRDYQKGSHGGMTGYWDKTKGPRVRNHCVNCHDPHSPGYPAVIPVPPPRDRFLEQSKEEH